jgi:endonuclease YncB( thermonuclease family)
MNGLITTLVIVVLLFSAQASPKTITGEVVVIHQGDTFTIKSILPNGNEKLYKIRLSNIDTPELKQPFGKKANIFTASLIFGEEVQIQYEMVDFYGRLIGTVILPEGKTLNEKLIGVGLAWHYRVVPFPNPLLERLQYKAWRKKIGFWVDPSPIPPWEFRREKELAMPPNKENQMDYDLILNYGIIGNSKKKIYWWPDCKNYPSKKEKSIIFGYKQLAESMGYRSANDCEQ